MTDAAYALVFFGFVVAGLAAAASETADTRRRRLVVGSFLLYALGASWGAGLSQRDAWPFSDWPVLAVVPAERQSHLHLVAVDSRGTEHEIDALAWQPLAYADIFGWLNFRFQRLDAASRDEAAAELLDRAEASRARARAGKGLGTQQRILGPLAAPPYFLRPARSWSDGVPPEPFVGLRLYRETWRIEERRPRSRARVEQALVYEYRRP